MMLIFFYSFMAALFFAFLFSVPKKSAPIAAFIAGIGYVVFILISNTWGNPLVGYFVGTLIMAVLSEMAARITNMTTTIFITVGVIPLVPGLGLFQTMQYLVQNNHSAALQTGAQTLLAAGTIAMAIAVNTFIVKTVIHLFKIRKPLKQQEKNSGVKA